MTSDSKNLNISEQIELIMRQTDYTYEIAEKLLLENDYDTLKVIKNFLGVKEKKNDVVKSKNQEIYKQIRYKLDESMRDYNKRKELSELN